MELAEGDDDEYLRADKIEEEIDHRTPKTFGKDDQEEYNRLDDLNQDQITRQS